jgi:hypothetical protein
MPRDPDKVVQSVKNELLSYLEKATDHGGKRVGELFLRANTLTGFAESVLKDAANMGYLTLFFYEIMHEKVCIKYRAETAGDDPRRIMVDINTIHRETNNTLVQLVGRWKPGVGADTVAGMKVVYCIFHADVRPAWIHYFIS